eukprot:m.1610431 g.1610431  ORF g.1610431 m.1610431 type:complete len:228 (-) comp25366_c0_seq59:3541-4224(-)
MCHRCMCDNRDFCLVCKAGGYLQEFSGNVSTCVRKCAPPTIPYGSGVFNRLCVKRGEIFSKAWFRIASLRASGAGTLSAMPSSHALGSSGRRMSQVVSETNDTHCLCGLHCIPEACFCGRWPQKEAEVTPDLWLSTYEHERFSATNRQQRLRFVQSANESTSTCVMCRNGWSLHRGTCVSSDSCLAQTGRNPSAAQIRTPLRTCRVMPVSSRAIREQIAAKQPSFLC